MKAAVLVALTICAGSACAESELGGNLHRASLRDWRIASPGNQVATMTDIVGKVLNIGDPLALAPKVRDVQSCVSRIADNFTRGSQTVFDTAFVCMAELGYLRR